MSRIGKQPVVIPSGVKVAIADRKVVVEGPKGKLDYSHHPLMTVKVDGDQVLVTRGDDGRESRSLHGLTRSLIQNMVEGVSNGYKISLDIIGAVLRHRCIESTAHYAKVDAALLHMVTQPWLSEGEPPC